MSKEETGNSRRDFLKLAGVSAPAVAVLATAGSASADPLPVDPTSETMQDTAHTRAYLDSARF